MVASISLLLLGFSAGVAGETQLVANSALLSPDDLPKLTQATVINGDSTETTAQFFGGISVDGSAPASNVQVELGQEFTLHVAIETDPAHIGQQADLLMVVGTALKDQDIVYVAIDNENEFSLVDLNQPPVEWTASLPPITADTTLQTAMKFTARQGSTDMIGDYHFFFGYRLANNTVVYNSTPIILKVEEANRVSISLDNPATGEIGETSNYSNQIYGIGSSGCSFYENWYDVWDSSPAANIQGDGCGWDPSCISNRVGVYLPGLSGNINLNYFNDEITVVKVDKGCTASLWEHYNLQGRKLILTAGVHSLTDYGFNDMASSISCYCDYLNTYIPFDGNNYYEVERTSDNTTMYFHENGEFTIMVWVYLYSYINWVRVMDFSNGPSQDNVLLAASHGTSGKPTLRFHIDGAVHSVDSPVQIPFYQLTHLAATFANNHGKLYINGELVAENTSMAPPKSVIRQQLYLGKSSWPWDGLFKGTMRDFRLYSKALNENAIKLFMSTSPQEKIYLDRELLNYSGYIRDGVLYDSSWHRTDAIRKEN